MAMAEFLRHLPGLLRQTGMDSLQGCTEGLCRYPFSWIPIPAASNEDQQQIRETARIFGFRRSLFPHEEYDLRIARRLIIRKPFCKHL